MTAGIEGCGGGMKGESRGPSCMVREVAGGHSSRHLPGQCGLELGPGAETRTSLYRFGAAGITGWFLVSTGTK